MDIDLSSFQKLRLLVLLRVHFERFPILPPCIESLKCNYCPNRVIPWSVPAMSIGQPQPAVGPSLRKLRTIQFLGMGQQILAPLSLLPQAGEVTALRQLDLFESSIGLGQFFNIIARGSLRQVVALRISFTEFGDDNLTNFVQNCPNIKTLILSNTKVTGVFVKGLVIGLCGQLKCLMLEGIDSKVSHDAVLWAGNEGVDIRCGESITLSLSSRHIGTMH